MEPIATMYSRREVLRNMALCIAMSALSPAIRSGRAFAEPDMQRGKRGIFKLNGHVTVNGKNAAPDQPIRPGDELLTGPRSSLTFTMGRSAYLVRASTRLLLERNSDENIVHRLFSGGFLAVFGGGTKKIVTPNAIAGVRGSGVYTEIMGDLSYICLCYGEIELRGINDAMPLKSFRTKHHDQPHYIGVKDGITEITKAPMLNHSDNELIMLESLVGRVPPFYDPAENSAY